MKILITGATGFVGKVLTSKLLTRGHEIVTLTRDTTNAQKILGERVTCFTWADTTREPSKEAFKDVNGIVNLMGEGVASKRWSDEQKKKIYDSRITSTKNLLKAAEKYLDQPLKALVSASATGFYGVSDSQEFRETDDKGTGFLADVCADWEKEAAQFKRTARTVIIRIGVVLGKDGGALSKMLPLFKLGLGGKVGSGTQYMSWIHRDDLVNLIVSSLEIDRVRGIMNAVAPEPVTNAEFTKTLAKVLHRPALFPAPAFALKAMLGEMATIVLDSQKVSAKKLTDGGFEFKFPTLRLALEDICHGHKKSKAKTLANAA